MPRSEQAKVKDNRLGRIKRPARRMPDPVERSIVRSIRKADALGGRKARAVLKELEKSYFSITDSQEYQRRVKAVGDTGLAAAFNFILSLRSPKGICPRNKIFNLAKIASSSLVNGNERRRMAEKLDAVMDKTSPDAKQKVKEFMDNRLKRITETPAVVPAPSRQGSCLQEPLRTEGMLQKESSQHSPDMSLFKITGSSWRPQNEYFFQEDFILDSHSVQDAHQQHLEAGNETDYHAGGAEEMPATDYPPDYHETSIEICNPTNTEAPLPKSREYFVEKKEGFYLSPVHFRHRQDYKSQDVRDYDSKKGDLMLSVPRNYDEGNCRPSLILSSFSAKTSSTSTKKGREIIRSLLEKLKTHGTTKRMGFAVKPSEGKKVPEEKKEKPEEKKEKKPKRRKEKKKPKKEKKIKKEKKPVKKEKPKPKKKKPPKKKDVIRKKKPPEKKSKKKEAKKKKTVKKLLLSKKRKK